MQRVFNIFHPLRLQRYQYKRISSFSQSPHAEKLSKLRELMKKSQYSAYLLPISDPHLSEYISNCFTRLLYLSNFTGSSGTVVITESEACLWTDGRYHLQAELELDPSLWKLMKDGNQDVPSYWEYLCKNLPPGSRIGYDSTLHSAHSIQLINDKISRNNLSLVSDEIGHNLIDSIWGEIRPPIPSSINSLRLHPIQYAGLNATEKLTLLREKYFKRHSSHQKEKANENENANSTNSNSQTLISGSLDEIAWLYNIRGNDVKCNPTMLAYTMIQEEQAILYLNLDQNCLSHELQSYFQSHHILIRPYDKFFPDLLKLVESKSTQVLIDPVTTNDFIWRSIPADLRSPLDHSPIEKMKAIKNTAEINGMKSCHLRDGAALCHFLWELFHLTDLHELDEVSMDEKLSFYRKLYSPKSYLYPSFDTIAGVGPNGAIIHYRAKRESCRLVSKNEILLLDSGGQYVNGTTDITRTIHLSQPTPYEKEMYTRVLMGHIDLASTIFPSNTPGCLLDAIPRRHLWGVGKNYLHGTGHGVGAALNVHEGPQKISSLLNGRNFTQPLLAGMIVSIEPGYYEANSFGIRLENLYQITSNSNYLNYFQFESLTYVPFQKNFLDISLMSTTQIDWLNNYHQQVFQKIQNQLMCISSDDVDGGSDVAVGGQVAEETKSQILSWLKMMCEPIHK